MSKYIGKIVESGTSNIAGEFDINSRILVTTNKCLYVYTEDSMQELRCLDEQFSLQIYSSGVWVRKGGVDGVSLFYKDVDMETPICSIDEWVSGIGIEINDVYISKVTKWGEECIFSYSTKTNKYHKYNGRFSVISTDDKYVFARERREGLVCFDSNLNKIWQYDLGGQSYSKANQLPQFSNNLVILNHSHNIFAIDKETGKLAWQYKMSCSPGCFTVDGDKVYTTEITDILILDACTGELIVKKDSGYSEFNSPSKVPEVGAFPVGDLIYTFARYHSQLRFISIDVSECVQELELFPTGYATGEVRSPLIKNGIILQNVVNTNAYSANGLLVLKPCGEQNVGIVKQERLSVEVYAIPSLDKVHVQRIYVKGDSVNDICRFAVLTIKELNYETGVMAQYTEKKWSLDRKHNGIIELCVDDSNLGDNAKVELDSVVSEINLLFKDHVAYAGDGKTQIKIVLMLQDKNEWDFTGDLIVLDDIRKIRKPIS